MADNSLDLTYEQQEHLHQSPFDRIRRFDEQGNEYWLARELMKLLGYTKWENFGAKEHGTVNKSGNRSVSTISRAIISCSNSGLDYTHHFTHFPALGTRHNSTPEDWKLSRHACYLIAMCGDVTKPAIAQAQSYFAVKTREAEVIIPAQNDRLRELELINENMRMQLEISRLQDNRIALHGLPIALMLEGKADAVVEVEKKTLEVIDERHNVRFRGQSLTQIKETLQNKHGIRLKSGADVLRTLKQLGLEHLVCQTLRSISSDYVPEENLKTVYQAITNGDRQLMLGES